MTLTPGRIIQHFQPAAADEQEWLFAVGDTTNILQDKSASII